MDGNFEFHRILGDANGDAIVDEADLSLVTAAQGSSGPGLDADVNGDNTVNIIDRIRTSAQQGVSLDEALKQMLDD